MLLYGIVCTWNESDIIHATVKNLYNQGCDKVFFVDNCSTDNTIEEARRAGAILLKTFETKYFDEIEKVRMLNASVKAINDITDHDNVWWIYIDADEYPIGWSGQTLKASIESSDNNVGAIHSQIYNHIPTSPPFNLQGYYPGDFQLDATISATQKIQLLKYIKHKPHIISLGGFHYYDACGENIIESCEKIELHHFNYRCEDFTRHRLKLLTAPREDGTARIDWYSDYTKRVHNQPTTAYHQRLKNLKDTYASNTYNLFLKDALCYDINSVPRWYRFKEMLAVVKHEVSVNDFYLWRAFYNFFSSNFIDARKDFSNFMRIATSLKEKDLATLKIIEISAHIAGGVKKTSLSRFISSQDELVSNLAKNILAKFS